MSDDQRDPRLIAGLDIHEYLREDQIATFKRLHQTILALTKREAECHDIITELWARTDPESTDKELLQRVARVLGADHPDGDCGNDYCGKLDAAEASLARLREVIGIVVADMKTSEMVAGQCALDTGDAQAANEANRLNDWISQLLTALDPSPTKDRQE